MELRIGMRVKGTYDHTGYSHNTAGRYTGTVISVHSDPFPYARVKRDDYGKPGGTTLSSWEVHKKSDGSWGGDGREGTLHPLYDTSLPWEP